LFVDVVRIYSVSESNSKEGRVMDWLTICGVVAGGYFALCLLISVAIIFARLAPELYTLDQAGAWVWQTLFLFGLALITGFFVMPGVLPVVIIKSSRDFFR